MTTPNLGLPEWQQNQNQPHATVDLALRILDCLAQLVVQDRDLDEPPTGSIEALDGECFIVSGPGTGLWAAASDGDVAMLIGTGWVFRTPQFGWRAYVVDEDVDVRFTAGSPSGGWETV